MINESNQPTTESNGNEPVSERPVIAREDALAAIQRRLFSCDHVQIEAMMKVVYRKAVTVVSDVRVQEGTPEADGYAEVLKLFV